jgi:hypothetical protein
VVNYLPVLLVLIVFGRYLANRGPARLTSEQAERAPDKGEKTLTWAGVALTACACAELYLTKWDYLTDAEAYWLNLLPLLWLGLTLLRKDIPGDRTATNVGLWTITPYAAYGFSPKQLPESAWLSLCVFGAAFFIGTWRDIKRPA